MIDAHVVTHGALTVSGLIALAVGMLMLFHDAPAQYKVDTWFVLVITATSAASWPSRSARQCGPTPSVRHAGDGRRGRRRARDGLVFVQGELWQAATEDGAPLEPGAHVQVDDVEGLRLKVHRV